jgi:hypothetical protein
MGVKDDRSQRKLKICTESLKEGYKEEFMAKSRKIVYEDKGITMNFIYYVMNQIL